MRVHTYTWKLGRIWLTKTDMGGKARQGEKRGQGRVCAEKQVSS